MIKFLFVVIVGTPEVPVVGLLGFNLIGINSVFTIDSYLWAISDERGGRNVIYRQLRY